MIAELFLEGSSIFTLSQLLRYRKGDYDPLIELAKIEQEDIRVGFGAIRPIGNM